MKSLPVPNLLWQISIRTRAKILFSNCMPFLGLDEVDTLPDTLSATVINATKAHFAWYGIPRICHTDNGPQFISKENQGFVSSYHFKNTRSSPYYLQGNCRAEAAVKVVKNMLKNQMTSIQRYWTIEIHRSKAMINHRTRTLLRTSNVILKSRLIDTGIVFKEISQKRANAKLIYDRKATVEHVQSTSGSFAYAKPPPQRRGDNPGYTGRSSPKITGHTPYKRHNELSDRTEST